MIRLLRQRSKDDFELKSFTAHTAPPYAILSHTWTDGAEVTYDDLVASTGKDKAGYDKIRFCGQRAAEEGLEYFWVDTCCIDKSSSAELSESINSMYRWYQQADVCYAYIEDWPSELTWADPLRWFTRGWTLQELIAPKKMEFFDGNQKSRGMKFDPLVVEELSRITGISASVLSDRSGDSLRGICYGQRMSWAAYRKTTRIEDIAYCLLGIFHIHMPLLYGEGVKAFTRLQEVILASSTDLSLLAWTQSPEDTQTYRGILSRHPHEFRSQFRTRSL
ncbi:heterokaryon incompatibility protein-domain-containing protein [Clohesyomyces aquaticus]|uniref:Heterokaryon incompatibility protein-domain-containing protein n=1 Tax=Clohesyomyces aquaticus TaxID=1231657 RepID=A0A1Y2A0E6_9PLEO|nr:heterokaryon incompatibility protein-domain-containing protein [Clohesyomyces aquaticus]